MILIGSAAIKHWFPDFPREPKDRDYITQTDKPYRVDNVEYLPNPVLIDYPGEIMGPDELYTLKISHMFWDFRWDKHMYDIQFMKTKGCRLIPSLFADLFAHWCIIKGTPKRSNLDMTADAFFDNALKKYDHDALHYLLVASPTFLKVLKDGAEVDVCEHKFKSLTHEEKLSLVREEIYVMAYERLAGRPYRTAYSWMLKKFIINHAPIWEAVWILDNYNELYKPHINYKQKLDYELLRHQQNSKEAI